MSELPGQEFGVVAVAASAGGVAALAHVLGGLPADFPAPVLVALHRSPYLPDMLPAVLGRGTALPVATAEEGELPRPGRVYTARPGSHLMVGRWGQMSVRPADRVRFVRPSADLLFASVAAWYGPRAVAAVLTGAGDDGAAGVRAVRRAGGFVLAQDERTAEFFDMPRSAIDTAAVDLTLPLGRMAYALTALVMGPDAADERLPHPGPVGRLMRSPSAAGRALVW